MCSTIPSVVHLSSLFNWESLEKNDSVSRQVAGVFPDGLYENFFRPPYAFLDQDIDGAMQQLDKRL